LISSYKYICTYLCFTLSIISCNGCIPVVATSIFATAVAVTDRRTAGIIVEDETIELKTLRSISNNYSKELVSISATSFNRTVLLTGWAPNQGVSKEIGSLVANIANVREIINEINIGPRSTTTTYAKDSILTTKVKASLIDENSLNGNAIKVKTESSIVFLMGIVTNREADLAADIASRVVGTRRVVKAFEIVTEEELSKIEALIASKR
jgi:osmotically-inducible protein OsmY